MTRPSTVAPILTAIAIVLPVLLVGAYLGGYFWLANTFTSQNDEYVVRFYRYEWLRNVYAPVAIIEGRLRGNKVELDVE